MTIFSQNKKNLFRFFFLCYFIVYAISPLTYTLYEKRPGESFFSTTGECSGIWCADLLFWEFLREKTEPRDKAPADAGDTIIMQKKRALLPENGGAAQPFFQVALLQKNLLLTPGKTIARVAGGDAAPALGEGFSLLYAGHSPPLY